MGNVCYSIFNELIACFFIAYQDVKAQVKSMMLPRYKIICLVHIGQLLDQGLKVSSRCLWDASNDTSASYEFRNSSMFASAMVYGVYYE